MSGVRPSTIPPIAIHAPAPPIGCTVAGYVIDEHLRGEAVRGQYRARRAGRPDLGTFLVTIGLPQRTALREVEQRLRIGASRVAALRQAGAVEIELHGRATRLEAIIEDEPAGQPLHLAAPASVPVPIALGLGVELARSVEEAHRSGAPLLGIRPELVYVVTLRDRLVLSGIAPRCERFQAGATPAPWGVRPSFDDVYLAPEQIEQREAGTAADVFSLCALLARLVIGVYPFEGDGPWSKAESIIASRRRRITAPMKVVGLLAHGLALNAHDRPTVSELGAELARLA
jgi:hypothetical protein